MIEDLVQKYGKPIIKELIDAMIINGNIKKLNLRDICLKYGLITKATKIIRNYSYKCTINKDFINGRYVEITPSIKYYIHIVNGRNQSLFYMDFKEQDIPHIIEVLYKED